jgi:hypothetical protein
MLISLRGSPQVGGRRTTWVEEPQDENFPAVQRLVPVNADEIQPPILNDCKMLQRDGCG